ncbi:hypothetical protein O181_077935 [Austropuccinia psidii MF-1]|uniref:RING-type domain-containing protein n=1 Tax=Austropuccinia psidii MF-1 TaxID=1389203 RepID=A0A9Q3FIV0_9BASI|nr:hypothetical protein [Austropuccinia psidii MF-1]
MKLCLIFCQGPVKNPCCPCWCQQPSSTAKTYEPGARRASILRLPSVDEEREISRLSKLIDRSYLNKRLEPQVAETHLRGLVSESQQEIRNLRRPLEALELVAAELAECGECDTMLNEVDAQAREVIGNIRLIELRQTELEELRESVHQLHRNPHKSINTHLELCQKLSNRISHWNSLSARQKFAQDSRYKNFRQRIWEASGSQGVMPNLKTFLPNEKDDQEPDSSDDELEIGGGTQNYKCPFCLAYLKTPLVSQICQHAFCKDCFESYVKQSRVPEVSCPTVGCSQMLHPTVVQVDDALAVRIRHFLRRKEQREAEEELESSEESDDQDDVKPTASHRAKGPSQKKKHIVVDDD